MLADLVLLAVMALVVVGISWLRGPWAAAALILSAFIPVIVVGFTTQQAAVPKHYVMQVKTCWLNIGLNLTIEKAEDEGYTFVLDASYQAPDPCHRILGSHVEYLADKIILYVEAESPPPGTVCAQVLPPPVHYTTGSLLKEKPTTLLIVLHDRTSGTTCKASVNIP